MLKINRFIAKFLLYSVPIVAITIIWSEFRSPNNPGVLSSLQGLLSWYTIVWFIGLFYFALVLTVSSSTREKLLSKIAGIKERDEREVFIAGEVSKKIFLTMLSVLILLLFVSMLSVHVVKLPKDKVVDGKEKSLIVSFRFSLFDSKVETNDNSNKQIFAMDGLPLSNEGLLFLLLLFQVSSYQYFARSKF